MAGVLRNADQNKPHHRPTVVEDVRQNAEIQGCNLTFGEGSAVTNCCHFCEIPSTAGCEIFKSEPKAGALISVFLPNFNCTKHA